MNSNSFAANLKQLSAPNCLFLMQGYEWSCLTQGRMCSCPKDSSNLQFSSVQSLSRVWLFATPWIAAHQASLSITTSRSSLRLTSIESMMPSSHLILCRPLLLLSPIPESFPSTFQSTLRMRWPKYWSFSFSIIPSKETPGLISFTMDWLDLLAVQGTLKSLLQHHSSKASTICNSPTRTRPKACTSLYQALLFSHFYHGDAYSLTPINNHETLWVVGSIRVLNDGL